MHHLRERLLVRGPRELSLDAHDKKAAVAAVLWDGPLGAEVLLIQRAERPGDPWSGHMALPGGRHDASDGDLLRTALRETHEEVGVDLSAATLLAPLDDIEAVARGKRTGLLIRPYVFHWTAPEKPVLKPEPGEVADALWTPLAPLHQGERDTVRPYEMNGTTWQLPGWDVDGRIVWGLTHRILSDLFSRVLP